jgi:hypothetical protein
MPIVATLPSIFIHSWSFVYFNAAGKFILFILCRQK